MRVSSIARFPWPFPSSTNKKVTRDAMYAGHHVDFYCGCPSDVSKSASGGLITPETRPTSTKLLASCGLLRELAGIVAKDGGSIYTAGRTT
jgi:hypothetical protein